MIDPWALTWPEVDPVRHPFDPGAAPTTIRAFGRPDRFRSPGWAACSILRSLPWGDKVGDPWADAMSAALVERYARWTCGWRWALGESDYDGGPIRSWCCSSHSITTPATTVQAVTAAVVEWRAWLEELAGHFDRFLPIPCIATDDEVFELWQLAVSHLVNVVVERTEASSGRNTHCEQVLGWFLTAAGIPADTHREQIEAAIGGRFDSGAGAGAVARGRRRGRSGRIAVTATPCLITWPNARAAMLCLAFVLHCDQARLDLVTPALQVTRTAGDLPGSLALIRLIEMLIAFSASRAAAVKLSH